MNTSLLNHCGLSRLMLGTVQFGMPYGVANRTGQPSYRDVVNIVAEAVVGGVNCFDTAAAYGTSEEVLGRVIAELQIADQITIVTKIRPFTSTELSDGRLAAEAIEESVPQSRQRLQQDCLPIVLFHREPDAAHSEALAKLQTKGWVDQIGVSCDNRPGPADAFAASGTFSALQIPGNILDRRHQESGIFRRCESACMAVFVRSVYLQGLLLIPDDDVPQALRSVIPIREHLTKLAGEAGMGLAELSLRYMLSQAGVTSVLTGVETVNQIQDNLAMFSRGPLPRDLLVAIDDARPELTETVLTPGLWNRGASVSNVKPAEVTPT